MIPVELVELKPVSFKAPEVRKVAPKLRKPKPQPKKLEGVTVEKPKVVKEEPEQRPQKQPEEPKKSDKGEATVGSKNIRLDAREFPFSYYLALLRSRIQSNWEPPVSSIGGLSLKTVVYFRIRRNGQLSDIAIETRSGDYLFDQASLRAVTLANPLPPLPFDFSEPALGVHFEFEQGR